jgi:HEAT repeat protein
VLEDGDHDERGAQCRQRGAQPVATRWWNGLVDADRPTLPALSGELAHAADLLRAAHGRDGDSLALLMSALDSEFARDRVLALRGLDARDALDAAAHRRALLDPAPEVRREAAELAGSRETPSADDLVSMLADPDPLVVEAVAYALGERRASDAVAALGAVAREHDDARCREAAVAALGAIGDDAGLDAVLEALTDKPPVRRRAVVALAAFEGPRVEAALEAAKADRDWQVRSAAERLSETEDDPEP